MIPAGLTVPRQFCGPPGSANGGWSCGLFAAELDRDVVTVTLRLPPPLDEAMRAVTEPDGRVLVRHGDDVVAEVAPGSFTDDPPAPCTLAEAAATGPAYPGHVAHPFPTCFACGTGRTPAEGLCLQPGPLPGRPGEVAAAWRPAHWQAARDRRVTQEITWAALDCPGAWAYDVPGRPMVLGRMTGQVHQRPWPGEDYVVVGRADGAQGRKRITATALYDRHGTLLAQARHVWILVDPATAGRAS